MSRELQTLQKSTDAKAPSNWKAGELLSFLELQRGVDLPVQYRRSGQVPILGSNGVLGFHDTSVAIGPGVVTGRSGTIGKLFFVEGEYWPLNTSLYVKNFKGNLPKFVYFKLDEIGLGKFSTGTGVPTLNRNVAHKEIVAFPPLPEQKKIAAILTAVDDKLDVISRQIEATQTLRQGLMQTLFSRGVGTQDADGRWLPHADFKDSELGMIPSGWGVQPLMSLSESITVGIATSTTEHYVNDGVPLVRNQNIKEDFLDLSDLLRVAPAFDIKNKTKRVKAGDILTVRTGYPGVSCVVPEGLGNLQTFTTLITRPKHEVLSAQFASRYFNSPQGKKLMLHQAAGGAQQNINAGNLKKLRVPLPPFGEQEKIAEIISAVEGKTRVLAMKKTHFLSVKRGLMKKLLTGEWRVKLDSEMTP